jgi:hypothetical protein
MEYFNLHKFFYHLLVVLDPDPELSKKPDPELIPIGLDQRHCCNNFNRIISFGRYGIYLKKINISQKEPSAEWWHLGFIPMPEAYIPSVHQSCCCYLAKMRKYLPDPTVIENSYLFRGFS